MLPLATGIGKAEVHKLDFVLLRHLDDVGDGFGHL
jgi:hypothetical protein